jgi:hypothetical protein
MTTALQRLNKKKWTRFARDIGVDGKGKTGAMAMLVCRGRQMVAGMIALDPKTLRIMGPATYRPSKRDVSATDSHQQLA